MGNNCKLNSEAGARGLKNFEGRIDVGHDSWTVTAHHLPERAGDVWTDGTGSEDFLGEDDSIDQVRGAQPAVVGHLVSPVADLDPLRL
jgi:hypothetical protein